MRKEEMQKEDVRKGYVKRLLAILAFLAGGIGTEIVKPLQCTLMMPVKVRLHSRKVRCADGKH